MDQILIGDSLIISFFEYVAMLCHAIRQGSKMKAARSGHGQVALRVKP